MKATLFLLCLLCSCSGNFFGANVEGNYKTYYDDYNKLTCAYVTGWHENKKCMCSFLAQQDSNNIVFMVPEDDLCANQKAPEKAK